MRIARGEVPVDDDPAIGCALQARITSELRVRAHPDGGHHDHMVCVDTGEVIEFIDPAIEKRQKEIVAEHGFELVDHNLVLYVRKRK